MNNGVGESGSQHQRRESQSQLNGKRKLFRGNDFSFAIAKMAVAQICESVEIKAYQESSREGVRFSSFQESALESLTDVAVQYIENIGKTAHLYANVAGRVESNALDIVQALEDLGSGVGFAGVSDTDCCLADSGAVKDVIRYVGEAEEIPFVYSLPRFPINKEKKLASSFSEVGAEPPDEHIPVWLPAFPETNRSEDKTEGEEVPSKENGPRLKIDVQKPTEGELEGANPFLNAPLRFVEKEVSPVFRSLEPSKGVVSINHVLDKHMSNNNNNNNHQMLVLEASAPFEEINKKNKLAESEDEEKKDDTRTQRNLVSFKIGTTKKPLRLPINRSFQESVEDKREKKSEIEEQRERIEPQSIDSDVK